MSGHSKWATIKRAKAITDAKRGASFTKLVRNVTLAASEGGSDINSNFILRMAVERAKAANVPADNIERAIKKGTGELKDGAAITTALYEATLPVSAGQVALLIQVSTDNTNRALGEVRSIVEQSGGKLSPTGSISWQFAERGQVIVLPQKYVPSTKYGQAGSYAPVDPEEVTLELLEYDGIEDINSETDYIEVITKREILKDLHDALTSKGYKVESAELAQIPKERVSMGDEDGASLQDLIEKLEESNEVTNVWHNAS